MSGCVGEETVSPEENISVNETAELNVTETTEQEPVTETPVIEVPLKEGYTRYSDDILGISIDYPEDWELGIGGGVEDVGGVAFFSPRQTEASLAVIVFSNETNAKVWLQDEMSDIESLKEIGVISKFENVTINGREGVEIIYDGWELLSGGRYEGPEQATMWVVVFDVEDYYYQVMAFTNDYDQYGDMLETSVNSFVIDEEQMAI
jgi:hypothetical protein